MTSWLSAINTSNIETLVLYHSPSENIFNPHAVSLVDWCSILRGLPNLSTLIAVSFDDATAERLIQALGTVGVEVLCPRLEALELMDLDLDDGRMWQGLLDIATARAAGGKFPGTFKKMVFVGCGELQQLKGSEREKKFNEQGVELHIEEDEDEEDEEYEEEEEYDEEGEGDEGIDSDI